MAIAVLKFIYLNPTPPIDTHVISLQADNIIRIKHYVCHANLSSLVLKTTVTVMQQIKNTFFFNIPHVKHIYVLIRKIEWIALVD